MEQEPPESGFDELVRLSQQFRKQEHEHEARERQREDQAAKTRDVLQGLREIKFSMAAGQLKNLATPEMLAEVEAIKNKRGNEDLRRIISGLADDMEKRLDRLSVSSPDTAPLANMMKILNILMDLYFSI